MIFVLFSFINYHNVWPDLKPNPNNTNIPSASFLLHFIAADRQGRLPRIFYRRMPITHTSSTCSCSPFQALKANSNFSFCWGNGNVAI